MLDPDQKAAKLFEGNLGLASFFARLYRKHPTIRRLPWPDVLMAAREGLWDACRRHQDAKGKLSTYAGICIKHELFRLAVRQGGAVQRPGWIYTRKQIKNRRSLACGFQAVRPHESVFDWTAFPRKSSRCQHIDKASYRVWLDQRRSKRLEPDAEKIREAIRQIQPRLQEVLRLRFWEGLSLEQTAKHLRVTRERARQLEKRAVEKVEKAMNRMRYDPWEDRQ